MKKTEAVDEFKTTMHDFQMNFKSCKKSSDHLVMLEACGGMVQDAVVDLLEQHGPGVQLLITVQVLTPQNGSAPTLN